MSRKKPPHYSNAKPANGTLNAASKMTKKKKKGKTMADKAKTKLYIGKELETCIIPTTSVAKKQESIPPAKTTNGVQNAASKKKDESAAHKAKNKQNHSKELEPGNIPTTGVAKKQETTLPSKTTNGAQHAASKKKDESPALKAKNKQHHSKELETCEKRERNAPAKPAANGTKKPASKKKNKKCDAIETETCIIPTTGVARKRKSPPRAANGAKLESAMPAKKCRPGAVSDSGSNSEAEDYIDRFFVDVDPDDAVNGGGGGGGASEDSEDEDDDYDTDTDDWDSEEDEDEEALSFQALLNYYGKGRDVKHQQTQCKVTAPKQAPAAYKPAPVPMASTSGWIVEDNDRDLSNAAYDEDVATQAVAKKSRVYGSAAAVDDSTEEVPLEVEEVEEVDEEEVGWSDDDCSDELSDWDDTDEELDSNSEMWTDASEEAYQQSWDTNSAGSEDGGLTYLRQPYDSDSYDEDYSPSGSNWEQENVLYIPRGMALIYDLNDDSKQFDGEMSQIIELPIDSDTDGKQLTTTDEPSDTDAQSDTSIPALVPIYNEYGEFIDSPEKIRKKPNQPTESVKSATIIGGVEAVQVVPTQEAMETDVNETEEKADGVKENGIVPDDPSSMADEQNVDGEEIQQSSRYRFYDAVEGRMALGVLKQDIYFYGHVSVQALYGRVEMLGYRLEPGETRTVNAARGYNAVNLMALPSTEPFDRATFEKTLEKLKQNFIDADISELVESFDPKESVLVLLRSDPAEAGLLPIICNFLEEYNLFPTVNTLTGKSPFRRTEFLLEVEFFTPAVAPTRSIPVFQSDPAWDDVQLQESSRLLVVGGKGAGKSTLCQFMVNRFIRQFGRILLVDLDIGQPLLHLPETISASVLHDPVLGVGCFARVQPLRSLLFGSLNVVSSPLWYLQNVRTLVQHCEADPDLKGVPWIINTMGYVGGFGEELMAAIIRLVQPTDLIQLTIPKHMKGAQNYENKQTHGHVNGFKFNILKEEMDQLSPQQQQPLAYRFHPLIVSFDQRGCPLHPPKRRTLSIMSQLVQILGDSNEWFTDIKPFSAPLDELLILNTRDEYTLSKDIMPNILNAMMVYLCERLDNDQYNCLGVGIVRAVDQNDNVHLLHHLPPDQLAKAKVLALCSTNLPSQIHLRLNSKMDGTIPYLQNVG